MRIELDGFSRVGSRADQEDAWAAEILEDGACIVVADGLDSHEGGLVASRTVVEAILKAFRTKPAATTGALRSYLNAAREALARVAERDPELAAMRTTLLCLLTDYEDALWCHFGDSRLYHLRKGRIISQTKDHSSAKLGVDGNETPEPSPGRQLNRHLLYRSFGTTTTPQEYEISHPLNLEPDDAFLLCTDGFWEHVLDPEIELAYARARHPSDWIQALESRFVERTTRGAADNHTAVVVMGRAFS